MKALIKCLFHPRVTVRHVKGPGDSAKSAGDRLHLNMHTPLTQRSWSGADYAAVQAKCGNLSENELTRNSSGNTRPQSSQLAEPLWTDPGLRNGISVCNLISTFKKSAGRELIVEHSPQILTRTHHHPHLLETDMPV